MENKILFNALKVIADEGYDAYDNNQHLIVQRWSEIAKKAIEEYEKSNIIEEEKDVSIRIDFSKLFHYAEKNFGIEWNKANDIFFRTEVLNYESFNEFYKHELEEYYDTSKPFDKLDDIEKGYYITNDYMVKNNIDELFIDNR